MSCVPGGRSVTSGQAADARGTWPALERSAATQISLPLYRRELTRQRPLQHRAVLAAAKDAERRFAMAAVRPSLIATARGAVRRVEAALVDQTKKLYWFPARRSPAVHRRVTSLLCMPGEISILRGISTVSPQSPARRSGDRLRQSAPTEALAALVRQTREECEPARHTQLRRAAIADQTHTALPKLYSPSIPLICIQ